MTSGSHPTEEDLVAHLAGLGIAAILHRPGVPMPTVPLAAEAIGVTPDDIVKSLLFIDRDGTAVLAVACGTARVDRKAVAEAAGSGKLTMADPQTVLDRTGYPAGGVSPVVHASPLRVVVDRRVAERSIVYGGGGSEDVLLALVPTDIIALTGAIVADIVSLDS